MYICQHCKQEIEFHECKSKPSLSWWEHKERATKHRNHDIIPQVSLSPVVIGDCPSVPALQNDKGEYRTAPFTTFDPDLALRYAEFAAQHNRHNDLGAIVWPEFKRAF